MAALSKEHFDYHPIWSEYYDFEERDEIVEWGVDPQWLEDAIDREHTGDDHCAYTILRPYPLPHRMRLYIKARLVTAANVPLEGVMDEDASVLSIWVGRETLTFNRHPYLSELFEREANRLRRALGDSNASVFPMRYATDFLDTDGKLIAGTFSLGTNDP